MKKALKIGIMGMIGFMLFVYGGLNGYCLAWSRLYDRGNYIGASPTFRRVFLPVMSRLGRKLTQSRAIHGMKLPKNRAVLHPHLIRMMTATTPKRRSTRS